MNLRVVLLRVKKVLICRALNVLLVAVNIVLEYHIIVARVASCRLPKKCRIVHRAPNNLNIKLLKSINLIIKKTEADEM